VISYELITNEQKGNSMEKEKLVGDLIANESTQWTEDDRETLMSLNEDALEKMAPVVEIVVEKLTPVQVAAQNGAADLKPKAPLNLDQYISNAPPEIQPVLRQGIATYNATKDSLITALMANERNTMKKEFLGSKDNEELQAILNLCTPVENEADARFDYSGQAPIANVASDEEPLGLPTTLSA